MELAFAVTLSDNYFIFLDHLIKSILKHNPKFNYDYYVFCDDRLSEDNKKKLLKLYDFKFYNIDTDKYFYNNKGNIKYFSIECFNLQYDKVIFQGADMLCLKSVDELVNFEIDLGMVREKRRPSSFNNGNMIIGKKYLNKETYEGLLESDYSSHAVYGTDQKVYNIYFKNKIQETPQKFNVLVTETDWLKQHEIIFLHYIHKPTLEKGIKQLDKRLYEIWHEYD